MKRQCKILLVEDDRINAFVFKKFFSEEFIVDHAENGKQAIDLFNANTYDLILMDINLGDEKLDGISVMKIFKKLTSDNPIPIIAVTAYAMKGDEERFLAEGFDKYQSKPVKREDLYAKILDLLKKESKSTY